MKPIASDPVDVCVITTIHRPFDARIYERELASLVEAELSVCLISPWPKPERPWLTHEWISLPAPRRRIGRLMHGFRTFQAAWKKPARAYHFHDIDFLFWAVLLHAGKKFPVIYDCHENYPEDMYGRHWIPAYLRPLLSKITRLVENWAVRRLGVSIVVVPHLVERFSSLGVRTVLVRNFAKWSPRRDLSHERALICTGTLSEVSGTRVLLEIGSELKRRGARIPLIVTDRFASENERSNFYQAVKNDELNIIIHPQVKPRNMDLLLSRACIGFSVEQDYHYMGLGYHAKLFEYMAMGLPVVASNLASNKKLVSEANCGLVVAAADPREYVDAVLTLLSDKKLFAHCRENGFKAVETIYNWNYERNKLIEFYKSIIDGRQ